MLGSCPKSRDIASMCGRFTLTLSTQAVVEAFQISNGAEIAALHLEALRPRYNIAPTQEALIVKSQERERILNLARWGFVPSGAADLSVGAKMINARSETVFTRPGFSRSVRLRRCLVP